MIAETARGVLLFGLPSRKVDACLTALAALMVGWSRFAYLANGPWEWDETLFARGILHFELAAHFPHPPGFPAWLAVGHLLMPLTGDPLLALQIASAAFSVAALWVLSRLGRSVAPPAMASLAALVVLAAPGPWLYAVRGFSSTAASVLALAAGSVLAGGLGGRRATGFTLLVTASFLVRPILLPPLAVLWVAGASTVRPLRRLAPGVAAGLAAILGSVLVMVHAEGGWQAFMMAFSRHSQRHFSRLVDNPGGVADLGLVKGFGGLFPAGLFTAVAVIGLVVWWRRMNRRSAAVWALVLLTTVAQLVLLQNRTYGRYAVGVQMAVAPLLAGAAAATPPTLAVTGMLAACGWLGSRSLPLVTEQHTQQLPGWRAVQAAHETAIRRGWTVVLEPELHPFASYLWHLRERRGLQNPAWILSPWAPEAWQTPRGPWLVATVHRHLYPDPLFGFETMFGGVSARLEPLTQQRFLEAWVVEQPPLPLTGWWPAEWTPGGRRFMWAAGDAELLMPPLSADAKLSLILRPAPGSEPLTVRWGGGRRLTLAGDAGESLVRLAAPEGSSGVSKLGLRRAEVPVSANDDQRQLAFQLFGVRAVDPRQAWTVSVARAPQMQLLELTVVGAYNPESFADGVVGVWLHPTAVLTAPTGRGMLRLTLLAPRPTAAETELWQDGRRLAGPLDVAPTPRNFEVVLGRLPEEAMRHHIEIRSTPYVPAEYGFDDPRELGVVLTHVEFSPGEEDLDGPATGP